jgi:hypothetical protein
VLTDNYDKTDTILQLCNAFHTTIRKCVFLGNDVRLSFLGSNYIDIAITFLNYIVLSFVVRCEYDHNLTTMERFTLRYTV